MAMFLDSFVQTTLGKLTEIAAQKACKVIGVKEEIIRLQGTLMIIRSFVQDADQKRHTDRVIDAWVKMVKDIMYDADDIIDLCMIEGGKRLELQHPSSSSLTSFPLSFLSSCFSCVKHRHEIANKIEELYVRLQKFAVDSQVIPKLEGSSNQGSQGPIISSRATSPGQVDSDIVGKQIEVAANDIIKWILKDDQRQCQVYGIIGMGGIGKTTLARKIFNDKKIEDNFPTRIWLSVSKNYSEIELLKQLIRQTGGGNDDSAKSIAELDPKLVNTLRSNITKILLVLDDLWSANAWNDLLRTPMKNSGVIGKILFTSRDTNVGRTMKATDDHIHHVKVMDTEGGWELLRKNAFNDEDKSIMPALKEVGDKIVEKCDGLPLAIKAIAGILYRKERIRREWEKVLESDLWQMNQIYDEIPRALYLSYEDLPSILKQCFVSCALFKGSTYSLHLIRLWMAEGYIAEQKDKSMEELGDDYYKELITRNLLQSDPQYATRRFFMMHDLLQALATNLMEEGITLNEGETLNINNSLIKIRWLSMRSNRDTLAFPSAIIKQNCLRVLLVYDSPETKTIEDDALKVLGRLRVLDLSGTSIGSIPNSIGDLLHLRCLNLDGTNICELPESIGHLINLQTLSISKCGSFHRLPNGITMLCNLRSLCLHETPLTHVLKGIVKLTNINYLEGFVVGCDDSTSGEGCDLEDLQCWSSLSTLEMHKLERASIKKGANILAGHNFLRNLAIYWSEQSIRYDSNGAPPRSNEEQIIKRAENVCNHLIPPSSLERLEIFNFPGRQFPGWIMSTSVSDSFPDLAYIKIENIPLCTVLPPLGQLPLLKYLRVAGALGIRKIGPEFLGVGSHGFSGFLAFPKLTCLIFEDMPNWEEWQLCLAQEEEKAGDERNHLKLFPNLNHCWLVGCSRLIALPDAFYHATNLKELFVENCERLERISSLPFLKLMDIEDCPCLEHVENVDMLQSLRLTCPETNNEFLPQWLLDLLAKYNPQSQHSLMDFVMICSLSILKSCLKREPNWHIFQQIPKVYITTTDGNHSMSYTKDPPNYDTTGIVDSE